MPETSIPRFSPTPPFAVAGHPGWEAARRWVLQAEGGYVHDPSDHGGETNRGITARTLRVAQERGIVPPEATVSSLTEQQALAIYEALYWREAHCSAMPPALGLAVFDAAVLHGPRQAVLFLQRALVLEADGIFGSRTQGAAASADAVEVLARMGAHRGAHVADLVARDATQRKFLVGWLSRFGRLEAACLRLLWGV